MGSQAFAHTDIKLGSRKCLSHISHIRGTDPLSQITGDMMFSNEIHVLFHCCHKFPVVADIFYQIAILLNFHIYTGADSCAFRTPVYHGDHIFQVLRIQRPDIESADRSLRNNIHNGSAFHDNSVNPRVILKMKSLGIYRMEHLENSV